MFFAVDPSDWEAARLELAGSIVWPRALAIVDLRYLQDRALRPRGSFPSRRKLAETWQWSPSKVSRLLIDVEAWSDPAKREAWDLWYAQNRHGSKVNQTRTKREPKPSQTRTIRGAAKPDNQEKASQKQTKSEPKANQNRIKREHRRVIDTDTDTTTATDTTLKETSDLDRVWQAYRRAWRRIHGSSLNQKPPKRSGLATVILEHGVNRALDLIEWFECSEDDRASFLRSKRIGHSTLFRPSKAADYLEAWVAPWKDGQNQRFTSQSQSQSQARPEPRFARRFRVLTGTDPTVIEGQ